jgi:hypothetical protein
MSASNDTIMRLAEAPAAYEPVSPGECLITNDRYVLFIARTSSIVASIVCADSRRCCTVLNPGWSLRAMKST